MREKDRLSVNGQPVFDVSSKGKGYTLNINMTVTGLLLIRMKYPENESPARNGFGFSQLYFESFLGGGLFTAAALPAHCCYSPLAYAVHCILTIYILDLLRHILCEKAGGL
jgi:hypothetical protein